jgi:biopolymer transport protein ExbD
MAPKTLVRAGLGAIAMAVVAAWGTSAWLKTRVFAPVDMAISLEAGRIESGEFEINLREDYWVYAAVDYSVDDYYPERCHSEKLDAGRWKVYRIGGGKAKTRDLWASAEELRKRGFREDEFHAETGKYQVEWEAPAGAECLNGRHPRLRVTTSAEGYQRNCYLILNTCVLAGCAGAALLLAALIGWGRGVQWERPFETQGNPGLRMLPGMMLRNVIPPQRHRPMALIKEPPNFGLVWGSVLYVLFVIFSGMLTPRTAKGLFVDIRERNTAMTQKSPWAETLGVYVDRQGKFTVNRQAVAREKLRAKLEEELGRRMVWTVYFEADRDCAFMDATYAFDTIQGLGAKVVWITPGMREGWKREAGNMETKN